MRTTRIRLAIIPLLFLLVFPVTGTFSGNGKMTATPAFRYISVNSQPYRIFTYDIGGGTYYRLRELARAADISITYDKLAGAIYIDTTEPYDGSDKTDAALSVNNGQLQTALHTKLSIAVNGSPVNIAAYTVDNYNYMELRDFSDSMGFAIEYDKAAKMTALAVYSQKINSADSGSRENTLVGNKVTEYPRK